jgi:hypothetical protein
LRFEGLLDRLKIAFGLARRLPKGKLGQHEPLIQEEVAPEPMN